jgi:hypothetical protein
MKGMNRGTGETRRIRPDRNARSRRNAQDKDGQELEGTGGTDRKSGKRERRKVRTGKIWEVKIRVVQEQKSEWENRNA